MSKRWYDDWEIKVTILPFELFYYRISVPHSHSEPEIRFVCSLGDPLYQMGVLLDSALTALTQPAKRENNWVSEHDMEEGEAVS
jgi:hypothetical protein